MLLTEPPMSLATQDIHVALIVITSEFIPSFSLGSKLVLDLLKIVVEEVLDGLWDEVDSQLRRNPFRDNALTIHSIYVRTAHLFQVRPVLHLANLFMYILDGSVESRACE